jgi:hypothetical protein
VPRHRRARPFQDVFGSLHDAAAQHEQLRVEHVDQVRQANAEVVTDIAENALRDGVSGPSGLEHHRSVEGPAMSGQARRFAAARCFGRDALDGLARSERLETTAQPAGAERTVVDDRAVPDFPAETLGSGEQLAIDHDARPDAVADVQPHVRARALRRSDAPFRQRARAGHVVHHHRQVERLL